MIRCIFITIVVLFSIGGTRAQQITAAEYFFDNNDPGFGMGNAIGGNFPSDSLTVSVSAPVTGLASGVHTLHVRCKDSSGVWRLYSTVLFSVEFGYQRPIQNAEAFVGSTDAGYQKGIRIGSGFPSDSIAISADISVANLPMGVHILTVRAFDEVGLPSVNEKRIFSIISDVNANLIYGEYFIDNDPGVGRATKFNFAADTSVITGYKFIVPALSSGPHAIYIRTRDAKGLWSHYLKKNFSVCSTYSPGASLHLDLTGHQAYFTSGAVGANSYSWDFGDNTSSTEGNPRHIYSAPGTYYVKHAASNACGSDTAMTKVVIKGIQSISPNISDNIGFYRMQITGAGFDTSDKISIRFNGQTFTAVKTFFTDSSTLVGVFSFNGIPAGVYDVFTYGNTGSDSVQLALTIVDTSYHKLWVHVISPQEVLVNKYYHVRVAVGNSGSNYAFGVPVHIRFNAEQEAIMITQTDKTTIDSFLLANTPWQRFYMDHDTISPTRVDSSLFAGLVVSYVAPGSVVYVDFLIMAKTAGDLEVSASVLRPYYEGVSLSNIEPRSSCKFLPPCLQCLMDIFGLSPGLGCGIAFLDLGCQIGSGAGGGDPPKWWDVVGGVSSTILNCVPIPVNIFVRSNILLRMGAGVASGGSQAMSIVDPESCPACFERDSEKNPIRSRFTRDPNIKTGPIGFTPENYISGNKPNYYRISFENVDTATAPVSEVTLTDTLDAGVFDCSSIYFMGYGFGDTIIYFDAQADSFSHEIDLRPFKNTIVRTRGWFEKESSTLKAQYSSFDPVTMSLTDTIDNGFLPPNKTAPEGEGFLLFSIRSKDGIPHLTALNNDANIYFDYNDAVITPTWINTIDKAKPSSSVSSLPAIVYDTLVSVSWTGTDDHAGVMDYNVYVSEDNGAYRLWKARTNTTTDLFKGSFGKQYAFYSVARDHVLNEEDTVSTPDAITSLTVPGSVREVKKEQYEIHIMPNPASEELSIQFDIERPAMVAFAVYNVQGQPILQLPAKLYSNGRHNMKMQTAHLSSGIYILCFQNSGDFIYRRFVISR